MKTAANARLAVLICGASMFVSAALLFMVQPMLTKMALPLLGGSPEVWNVSVVFYQVVLLFGYLYAHLVRSLLSLKLSMALHALLLVAVLFVLPIRLPIGWTPPVSGIGIQVWLLAVLLVSVGLPFFVLSATSPLVQSWFASTRHEDAKNPYFLYAASNIGSLLALVVYPLALESMLGTASQTRIWTIGYAIFVPLLLASAWVTVSNSGDRSRGPELAPDSAAPTSWPDRLTWIALAFVPSSLMLAVTMRLSTFIAPIPLLWTLPLGLYLLTFVIVFARKPPIQQSAVVKILPYALLVLVFLLALQRQIAPLPYIALNLLVFFLLALACHGLLAAKRPPQARLTDFYLCLSIGGALGGIFNTFVAPFAFPNVGEYPLAIVLACLALGLGSTFQVRRAAADLAWPAAIAALLVVAFIYADRIGTVSQGADLTRRLAVAVALVLAFAAYGRQIRFALSVGAILLVGAIFVHPLGNVIADERNFFGVKWVFVDPVANFHLLMHGGTIHGAQARDPDRMTETLAYYRKQGPIGQVFTALNRRLRGQPVAVLGLGAGTLACYGTPHDRWTFYEIDPKMIEIAQTSKYFSFLSMCMPDAKIVTGDGRLALARQQPIQNELMILDAYSGDSPPAHLLTREALDVYLRNLADDGVLAFNISNRFFDLRPVLGNLAAAAGMSAYYQIDQVDDSRAFQTGTFSSMWAVMARHRSDLEPLVENARWKPLVPDPHIPLWTDDYSSLVRVIHMPGTP